MNTKNVAGKGVTGGMVKRVAMVVGALVAAAAVATGVVALGSSPGPAVVTALALAIAVPAALYLKARVTSAGLKRQVQESCNWHMAEEHIFLDGQPFSLATTEQAG
jgi:hypothetical protein